MVVWVSFWYMYLPEESGPPGKVEMFVPEQWTTSKEGLLCQDEWLNPSTLWLLSHMGSSHMGFYFCSSVNKSCFPLFVLHGLDEMWLPWNPGLGCLQKEGGRIQRTLHRTSLSYSAFKKSAAVVTTVLILNDTALGKGYRESWRRRCLASGVMGGAFRRWGRPALGLLVCTVVLRHQTRGQWMPSSVAIKAVISTGASDCHPFSRGRRGEKQEWRTGKWKHLTLERTSAKSQKLGAPWKFPAPDLGGSLTFS